MRFPVEGGGGGGEGVGVAGGGPTIWNEEDLVSRTQVVLFPLWKETLSRKVHVKFPVRFP